MSLSNEGADDVSPDADQPAVRFPCGQGVTTCDAATGAPVSATHAAQPGLNFLLDDAVGDWHNASFAWGKGFVMTDAGAARWNHPAEVEVGPDGLSCRYDLLPDLELRVERRFGASWRERYRLHNRGARPLEVSSLAFSTPFWDLYGEAREALAGACCAHLWTGGSASYAWVLPLHGAGTRVGLAAHGGRAVELLGRVTQRLHRRDARSLVPARHRPRPRTPRDGRPTALHARAGRNF